MGNKKHTTDQSEPAIPGSIKSLLAGDNPFFNRIERAPYELAFLLLELPRHASDLDLNNKEMVQKADAARSHAENAADGLRRGLEGLGSLMFVAGANENNELDKGTIADLGELVKHIAVELQLFQHIQEHFSYALEGGAQ